MNGYVITDASVTDCAMFGSFSPAKSALQSVCLAKRSTFWMISYKVLLLEFPMKNCPTSIGKNILHVFMIFGVRARPLMMWGGGRRKYRTLIFFFLAEAFLNFFLDWRRVFEIFFFSIFSAPPQIINGRALRTLLELLELCKNHSVIYICINDS